jgi:hypothetical protein
MKKRTAKILKGLAITLVALGVAYVIWVGISAIKLHRAYAALRKDGRPMRAEEVIPPRVEDTNNAALLYESAGLLLKAMPARWEDVADANVLSPKEASARDKSKDLLGHLGYLADAFLKESLEEGRRAKLEALLGEDIVTDALAIVKLGTERPSCRFDLEYEAGLNMILSPVIDLRDLLRIVGAKARVEAEAGRPESAWELASMQLTLADALRTEPTIISQVVRISNLAVTCRTVQRISSVAPPSPSQYDEVVGCLKGLDDIGPLVASTDAERLLAGEWVFGQAKDEMRRTVGQYIFEDKDYAPDILNWLRFQRMCFRPTLLADHARYLRYMHEVARLLERPSSGEDFEALERQEGIGSRRHSLADGLIPAMGRLKHLHTRMTAEVRITRAGLALVRYRAERGAWPERLDALGLEKVDDPFAEGVLRYRPEGEGFVLYSVGEDEKDNGGVAKEGKQEKDFDIVWRFPDQPTR